MLSVGLAHNVWLKELGLARNSVHAAGARKLAGALTRNTALRRWAHKICPYNDVLACVLSKHAWQTGVHIPL